MLRDYFWVIWQWHCTAQPRNTREPQSEGCSARKLGWSHGITSLHTAQCGQVREGPSQELRQGSSEIFEVCEEVLEVASPRTRYRGEKCIAAKVGVGDNQQGMVYSRWAQQNYKALADKGVANCSCFGFVQSLVHMLQEKAEVVQRVQVHLHSAHRLLQPTHR